jgi:hypothetical protein
VTRLTQRVIAEYRQLPGLRLTTRQAARLWTVDANHCENVLNALVDAGYLYVDGRRQYARRDVADVHPVDLAALKAAA